MQQLTSEIYIMALRVGPKPQQCNVSDNGIAHRMIRCIVAGVLKTNIHVPMHLICLLYIHII